MTEKVKEKPFKFESEEQLLYAGTCIAASNLGFCIKDNNWHGAGRCRELIKKAGSYSSKANVILQLIGALGDEECDLYSGLIDERKNWVKFLKKDGHFNKDVKEYIEMAQED